LPEFSPDLQLLLTGALPPKQEVEISRLVACCHPGVDWQAFVALVERHHLIPTVYRNLSSYAAGLVPAPVLAALRERAEHNRQRVLQLLLELGRISEWFSQAGIPLCTLKGPVLAQRLFGDASLRTSTDLDLLVHPDRLAQADALLLEHGCQRVVPAIPLTPRQRQAYQQEWYHSSYFLPEPHIHIELHWSIASPDLVSPHTVAQMLSRAQPLPQFGNRLFALADEDLPVYLLVHGSKHNWVRLKWLLDFAAWLRCANENDWKALQARMTDLGLLRSLGQGALLANRLLALPVPGAIPGAQDARVHRLVRSSIKAIQNRDYRGTEFGKMQRLHLALYALHLKDGLRYKWDVLRKLWIFPHDWQDLPLPDALFPLYGLLRPFLWLRRYYRHYRQRRLAA
jgi:hypothetical protein